MKEFIEKIIGRLEEQRGHICNCMPCDGCKYIGDCNAGEFAEDVALDKAIEIVNQLAEEYINTSTDTSSGWIAFTQRELTEEEKEYYGDEIKYMLDCKLPEEDEEILVTYKWKDEFYVGNDTFLRDGSECYLDSGREFITEAIAWQSLPAPYKEGVTENE